MTSSRRARAVAKAGVASTLALLLTMGCVHRYPPTPDRDFEGIAAASADARFVRIFVIHGMGDHSPGYSDPLITKLAVRTALTLAAPQQNRQIRYAGGETVVGNLRISRYAGTPHGRDYRVYELTWSPITMPIKDKYLNYDRTPEYKWERAVINKALKENLIDRAFADAILYSGEFQKAMREPVKEAICQMLNDWFSGVGTCNLEDADIPGLESDQIVFVSSSLGSRMLFDSVTEMTSEGSERAKTVAKQAFAKTNIVYMLANQLSLLGLKDIKSPEGVKRGLVEPDQKGLAGFVQQWRDVQRDRNKGGLTPGDAVRRPLRIVAFSDPNDLLSFRLREDAASGQQGVELINVMVSNVPEIFGIVARPDEAHTSYGENQAVLELIVCGSKGLRAACN